MNFDVAPKNTTVEVPKTPASGMESGVRKNITEVESLIEGDLDFINANKENTITDPAKQSLFEKAMMKTAMILTKLGIKDIDDLVMKASIGAVGVGGVNMVVGLLEKMQHIDLSSENLATRGLQIAGAGAIGLTYKFLKETWSDKKVETVKA